MFWDEPIYDGGADVLAYAVDWMPQPPPFPMFMPSDDESISVYGLRAGVRYRVRVKAFNRIDDSMAATQKIAMAHSLVRFRDFDPFTGSVANGRPTTLRNDDALSGFELHADAVSLFWGDHMKVEVRKLELDESIAGDEDPTESVFASDVFGVKPSIDSRRSKFDDSAGKYEFLEPLRVCIATIDAPSDLPLGHSIGQITQDGDLLAFDSTSSSNDTQIKTCARVPTIDLNRETRYAVFATPYQEIHPQIDQHEVESRTAANTPIVSTLLILGHALILIGIRITNRNRNPRRGDP